MTSKVGIVNLALFHLGEAPITSLSDSGKPATTMSQLWDTTRDAELRAAHWSFAIERTSLAALSSAPSFGYARQFELPADFIRAVQVGERIINPRTIGNTHAARWNYDSTRALFTIEGSAIHSDEAAPLKLRYVKRVENVGLYDPLFVQSLALHLAMAGGRRISSMTAADRNELAAQHRAVHMEARRVGSIEQAEEERDASPWAISRFA